MKARAVLDTSVLLDADRHELLFLAKQRLYTIVWSAFISASWSEFAPSYPSHGAWIR